MRTLLIALVAGLGLEVGQTLMLNSAPDSDVHVRCGSIPLTRGRMGRRGANIAVQVTAPLTPAAARALTGGKS